VTTALLVDPTTIPTADIPAALGEIERAKAVLWSRLTTPVPTCTNAASSSSSLT